jgi:hypothetical protein
MKVPAAFSPWLSGPGLPPRSSPGVSGRAGAVTAAVVAPLRCQNTQRRRPNDVAAPSSTRATPCLIPVLPCLRRRTACRVTPLRPRRRWDGGGHHSGGQAHARPSALLVGVGGAIGIKYGGLFGGSAGAIYGGSAVNAIRAARAVMQGTPEADREALVSASYAVVGIGFATWLVWKTGDRKAAR